MARTGAAVAMGLGSVPASALAAEPPDPFVLPGTTLTAVTADIDDDGAREVVRITGDQTSMAIEAWDIGDGTWTAIFSDGVGDLAGSGVPESTGAIPVAILVTQVDGLDRVLVISSGYDDESGLPGCCFTIHELSERAGRLELRRMDAPEPPAESVAAVDLDGDGTDEIVVWSGVWGEDGNTDSTMIEVLRRDGGAWSTMASWEETGSWWVMSLVDSDGEPGSEVLATHESGATSRVAWVEGAIAMERTQLTLDGEQAWVAGSVDGTLIVSASKSLGLVRWPRGGEPAFIATQETEGWPTLGVIGQGPDALLLVQEHMDSGAVAPETRVLDMRLDPIDAVPWTPAALTLWEVTDRMARTGSWNSSRNIWPYFGPMDGDWGGDTRSYTSGGMLISAEAGGSFQARPSGSVVGQPIGSAGSDDAWMAIADAFIATGPLVYLQAGYASESRLALVPRGALRASPARDPIIQVAIEGGIETGRVANTVTVLAAPTGAEIIVTVVPGTIAVSMDRSSVRDHGSIVGELRLPVPHSPRQEPDRADSFERDLLLIGPDGMASVYRWEGTFAPEAPDLTAWTQAEPLSLEATVAGRTGPSSRVTVDGAEVSVNEFGAYRATVGAPPWPRTVVVVARDPFGGEQRATVQVIGLFDYRGLPWVPIAGAATLLGGAALFLRTPRHRPLAQRPVLDDGRLEDLDGDLI